MKHDPISGPLSRDELSQLVNAPFGQAKKTIQQYDPLFGLEPGEKIRWKVEARAEMQGTAYVMAASQEEADALADKLPDASFDWDAPWGSDIEIVSVEMDKK